MKKHDAATKVVCGVPPRTISNSNVDGDWVSMSRYDSIMLVYMSDVGVAGKDVTVTLRQARSASGGQAKNINSGQWYAEQATVAGDALTAIGGDDSGSWTDDGETAALAARRDHRRPTRRVRRVRFRVGPAPKLDDPDTREGRQPSPTSCAEPGT